MWSYRALALCLLSVACHATDRDACQRIGPHPFVANPAMTAAVAAGLGVDHVAIRQRFQAESWQILYVITDVSDPGFVFFPGPPQTTAQVGVWAGHAEPSETRAIQTWAMQHVPGIPPLLAHCFAIYVTTQRSM